MVPRASIKIMGVIISRYLPGAVARLQWSLERIIAVIGLYKGTALGLLSPIQRVSGAVTDVTLVQSR